MFNHQATNILNIHLAGECFVPQLTLSNNGKLFYPPSYLGVSQKQRLAIKNNAWIPLEFEFKVPEKYRENIIFDPVKTMINANEEKKITCTFTPTKLWEYIFSVPLQAISISDPLKEKIGFYNPGSGTLLRTTEKEEKII